MRKLFTKRVLAMLAAVLMLVVTLSSCAACAGNKVQPLTYTESELKVEGDVSFDQWKIIALAIKNVYPAYNGFEALKSTKISDGVYNLENAYEVLVAVNGASNETIGEETLATVKNKLQNKHVEALIAAFEAKSTADILDYDVNELKGLENSIDAKLLKKIAAVISVAYVGEFDAQTGLIVASRGQDYTSKDYDASSAKVGEMDIDGARHVIKKANDTVKELKDNGGAKDATTLSKAELSKIEKELEAKHVNALIEAFKGGVEVANEGFLAGFLVLIGKILGWLTPGYYVIGICIFAILVEILMLPFAIKQQKNSIKQASLRPKEMAIRNKYKGRNDQPTMQKMQAEIQELYQRENFSPFNGCWMLLVQLPIIMALYYIVIDPLRYVFGQGQEIGVALRTFATAPRAAGGLGLDVVSQTGTIELLSKMRAGDITAFGNSAYFNVSGEALTGLKQAFNNLPNFNIGPLNFGNTPKDIVASDWRSWMLLLVPVLTFLTYFATAKLNRKFMYQPAVNDGADNRQVACSNSMMDITMPAMSAIFTFAVPAVIGVYWAFRSWLGFAKTVIMSKVMPLPTFTEEDYKAAAKEMAGKKTVKKSANAGAVRSLHYIDDEDFEDTRARGEARRAAIEERERREKEERAKNAKFAVPMKKDKNDEKEESASDSEQKDNDKE